MSFALRVQTEDPIVHASAGEALERRMRVVVCGEPGAGKSSVINTMFGCDAVPCHSMSHQAYAVVVRHAPGEPRFVLRHDDDTVTRLDTLDPDLKLASVSFCEISVDAPHMAGIDVIEVPYLFSGEHGKELLAIVDQADFLIWVTIASQAWRLSERNVVTRLASLPCERKVLALSRSDKLRNAADRIRVIERVESETHETFARNILISSLRLSSPDEQAPPDVWQASGGATLVDLLIEAKNSLESHNALKKPAAEAPRPSPQATPADEYDDEAVAGADGEMSTTLSNASFMRAKGTLRLLPNNDVRPFDETAASILFAVHGFQTALVFNALSGNAEFKLENGTVTSPPFTLDTAALWDSLRCQFALGADPEDFVESAVMTKEHIIFVAPLSGDRMIYLVLLRDHTNLPIVRGAIQRMTKVLKGE